jgi:hypothetical protein
MAIVASTFYSDDPNYVLHTVYHDPLEIHLHSMCKWDGGDPIFFIIFIIFKKLFMILCTSIYAIESRTLSLFQIYKEARSIFHLAITYTSLWRYKGN